MEDNKRGGEFDIWIEPLYVETLSLGAVVVEKVIVLHVNNARYAH